MALDPAFTKQTRYMRDDVNGIGAHDGGIAYGGVGSVANRELAMEVPTPFARLDSQASGFVGRNFGGNTFGWKPMPAMYAGAYVRSDPQAGDNAFPPPYLGHLQHFQTTSKMSYATPAFPVGHGRRLNADGLNGEFPSRTTSVEPMRSIGGHCAYPG